MYGCVSVSGNFEGCTGGPGSFCSWRSLVGCSILGRDVGVPVTVLTSGIVLSCEEERKAGTRADLLRWIYVIAGRFVSYVC